MFSVVQAIEAQFDVSFDQVDEKSLSTCNAATAPHRKEKNDQSPKPEQKENTAASVSILDLIKNNTISNQLCYINDKKIENAILYGK